MSRLILIAAALLAAPVAAQTSPGATDTTPSTTENHGANAGTAGSDMRDAAGKPAKAKAKHKSHATDSASGNRAPVDPSNYLPTTQSPY